MLDGRGRMITSAFMAWFGGRTGRKVSAQAYSYGDNGPPVTSENVNIHACIKKFILVIPGGHKENKKIRIK